MQVTYTAPPPPRYTVEIQITEKIEESLVAYFIWGLTGKKHWPIGGKKYIVQLTAEQVELFKQFENDINIPF